MKNTSKYILTEQEEFISLLKDLNLGSLNENIFNEIGTAIKKDVKNLVTDVASGEYQKQEEIKDLARQIKEYLAEKMEAFGAEAVTRAGERNLISKTTKHNGKTMAVMAANLRESIDMLIGDLKDFYEGNGIAKQKDLKHSILSEFEIVNDYENIGKLCASFDTLLDKFGYGTFDTHPLVLSLRETYDKYTDWFRSQFAQFTETDFYEYFRVTLEEEIQYQLMMEDDSKPSDHFLIKTRKELAKYYSASKVTDFKSIGIFNKNTDNTESIQKKFLLDYTKYKSTTQISAVSRFLLDFLIVYKGKITGISKNSDDYKTADYIEDADHIVKSLISVEDKDLRRLSTRKDLKRILYMNSLSFLIANYWEGASTSKNGFYHIEDWEDDLTNFFYFIFVEKKDEFNEFFKNYAKVDISQLDTVDFYSIFKDKDTFRKYFKYLGENLTLEDLENPLINAKKVPITKVTKDGDTVTAPADSVFDQYNNEHYYLDKFKTKLTQDELYTFLARNTSQTSGNTLGQWRDDLNIVVNKMDIVKGVNTNFKDLLRLRDRYLKDRNINVFGDDDKVSYINRRKGPVYDTMENIVFILFYASECLNSDISTHRDAYEEIDFFRINVSPSAKIEGPIGKQKIENLYIKKVIEINNKNIAEISTEYIINKEKRLEAIEDFKRDINQKEKIETSGIHSYFKLKQEELENALFSFEHFKKTVLTNKTYAKSIFLYKDGLIGRFGKSVVKDTDVKIVFGKDAARNIYETNIQIAKEIVDALKIKLSNDEVSKYDETINMVYNIPLVYHALIPLDEKKLAKLDKEGRKNISVTYKKLLAAFKKLKLNVVKKRQTYNTIKKLLK